MRTRVGTATVGGVHGVQRQLLLAHVPRHPGFDPSTHAERGGAVRQPRTSWVCAWQNRYPSHSGWPYLPRGANGRTVTHGNPWPAFG